ncbi:MMPL family transporter [Streptomyces albireticuli]|nr:MMPL family transporter [Streptomyces albireticuli]MCD9145724.1 MMPL family transporter [Streptomyces albireticuli]MCD9165544.1 MMPL family transporter [Streptomyces albireticuli]MCD9195933.1 MMPL family transporter [Streptomyces albireticuli]
MVRLSRLALWGHRHHRVVLAVAALAVIVLSCAAAGLWPRLASGGYWAKGTESSQADRLLAERFGKKAPGLIVLARAPTDVDAPAVRAAGTALTRRIAGTPGVASASSYWTVHDPATRSSDGRGALILVEFAGSEADGVRHAEALLPDLRAWRGPLKLSVTGPAQLTLQVTERSERDLLGVELAVLPVALMALRMVLGSWSAALVLVVPGVAAIAVTCAVLRLLTVWWEITSFAPNLAVALGIGLAVDYGLLVVTRYREELGHRAAVAVAVATAGRTVVFSAVTVALCLSVVVLFPLGFLQSLAWAGIVVVLASGLTALTLLPALLAAAGGRIRPLEGPSARCRGRGPWRSGAPWWVQGQLSQGWLRLASLSTRRPLLMGGAAAVVLAALMVPFGHARFGVADTRILPPGVEVRATAEAIGRQFPVRPESRLTVVFPESGAQPAGRAVEDYARRVSAVPGVRAVTAPAGRYQHGGRVSGGGAPCAEGGRGVPGVCLVIDTRRLPASPGARRVVRDVRAVASPEPRLVTGDAARLADTKAAIGGRLPWALGIAAAGTLVLVFAFTFSVLIAFKALVLSVVSLAASLGAAVLVFQDGRLPFLADRAAVTGSLDIGALMTTTAVAWGLCLDYELFLLSRVQEAYAESGDNDRAVVLGVARTGRLVTTAALIISLTMAALAASAVTSLRMIGTGLIVAVIADATLVRGILVPAVMSLTGPANWWAPRCLARLRPRAGRADV